MLQKGFAHIILLLGVTIVAGIFIFFSSDYKDKLFTLATPLPTYSPERRALDARLTEQNAERRRIEELAKEEIPITTKSSKAGWVTYSNNNLGYEIDVPVGSFLMYENINDPYNYSRIQNYSHQKDYGGENYFDLEKGHFYLEIQAYDSQIGSTTDCSDINNLDNPIKVTIMGHAGYKGYIKERAGESAPIIYYLCIKDDAMTYKVSASEYVLTVTPDIINSFKLKSD